MDNITTTLHDYYTKCFTEHGASPRGVDWQNWQTLALHYDKMLAIIEPELAARSVSLLDVGCESAACLITPRTKASRSTTAVLTSSRR